MKLNFKKTLFISLGFFLVVGADVVCAADESGDLATPAESAEVTTEGNTAALSGQTSVPNEDKLSRSAEGVEISNGQRVSIDEKGFSIVPPVGWEVHKETSGTSLLMQIPYQKGVYQRMIQVVRGGEKYGLNQKAAEDAVKLLVDRRARSTAVIQNYKLLDQKYMELADGTKTQLFYTNFDIGDVRMMEMHMLVGDAHGHILMTYTDIADNFDADVDRSFVDAAFSCMSSLVVMTPATSPYALIATAGGATALIMFMSFFIGVYRKHKVNRLLLGDVGDEINEEFAAEGEELLSANVAMAQVKSKELSLDDEPAEELAAISTFDAEEDVDAELEFVSSHDEYESQTVAIDEIESADTAEDEYSFVSENEVEMTPKKKRPIFVKAAFSAKSQKED